MDDEEIIRLYFERDETAISHTAQKYGAGLKRCAQNILHDEQLADECLNDVYFKVWNAVPPEIPQNLSAYLFKICRRNALGIIERQSAQKRGSSFVALTDEMLECIPDDSAQSDPETERLTEALNSFLKTLDREKRIAFVKRYWYAQSIPSIAKELNCSEGRIRTMLYRTRIKLKKFLERTNFYE